MAMTFICGYDITHLAHEEARVVGLHDEEGAPCGEPWLSSRRISASRR
jgi:hypothetical protein